MNDFETQMFKSGMVYVYRSKSKVVAEYASIIEQTEHEVQMTTYIICSIPVDVFIKHFQKMIFRYYLIVNCRTKQEFMLFRTVSKHVFL